MKKINRLLTGERICLVLFFAVFCMGLGFVAYIEWQLSDMPKSYAHYLTGAITYGIISLILLSPLLFRLIRRYCASERERREQVYRYASKACNDSLTGLMNRAAFADNLKREVARCLRHKQNMALLFIDFDDFKCVNDKYGHVAGDEVLRTFARTAKDCLRTEDLIARFGGEEFVIFLSDVSRMNTTNIAERIRHRCEQSKIILNNGKTVTYTVSVGIAIISYASPPDQLGAMTPKAMLEHLSEMADTAMYAAKKNGKNCICFYDEMDNDLHHPETMARLGFKLSNNIFR